MTTKKAPIIDKKYWFPFILVTALFFMWGIPNNLNGILIKQFMTSFELTMLQASLIQTVFYFGYFVFALPSAMLMQKYSYKAGLIGGLLMFSIGCVLFWPAAMVNSYWVFLFALFIIASGLTFLETGANSFIVQLGAKDSAEQRLNLAQAFNPFGSILGVLIGTVFIFSGVELDEQSIESMQKSGEYSAYLQTETFRVITPYLFLALSAAVMALLFWIIKLPKIEAETEINNASLPSGKAIKLLFKNRPFVKGVLAQFLYVGAQVGTWSYFIFYVLEYTDESEKMAGYMLSGTLLAFMLGRLSATWLMKIIKPSLLMGIYCIINIGLTAICVLCPGYFGMWCLLLTSFFMSLMYPTIFAMSTKNLDGQSKIGASILVMSIIGGAILTPLMGYISTLSGNLALSMIVPLGAYIYIAYFALSSKTRS